MGMTPRDLAREHVLTGRHTAASGFLGELPAFIETELLAQPRGFSLRLEDGSRWWIGGSRHAAFMAEKLGNIMALQEGDPEDSRLIYFYDKDADRIEPGHSPFTGARLDRDLQGFCPHPISSPMASCHL